MTNNDNIIWFTSDELNPAVNRFKDWAIYTPKEKAPNTDMVDALMHSMYKLRNYAQLSKWARFVLKLKNWWKSWKASRTQ